MLYRTYEMQRASLERLGKVLEAPATAMRAAPAPIAAAYPLRTTLAAHRVGRALRLTHKRPDFGVHSIVVDGAEIEVTEDVVTSTPFASLTRFVKGAGRSAGQPPVLIVPGLAGHFATLVRDTVSTMLTDHDVFVADWHNARDVPVAAGRFGLDEYIEHLMLFLRAIGPGAHVVSVCQPAVASLVAAAVMGEDQDPARPASLILIAGPVDTRVNPGRINRFAQRQSISLLERCMVHRVPRPYAGAGRTVYPGFVQVAGFMSMSPRRHVTAFRKVFADLVQGDGEIAQKTLMFYEEYFAVLDVTSEFYLETAQRVFIDNDLPRGRFFWKGRHVQPSNIRSALLTIEGELDAMCTPGQTEAAHALCPGIPDERKRHVLQEGVGHYGVFAGSSFEREIYPQMRAFIEEVSTPAKPRRASGSRSS